MKREIEQAVARVVARLYNGEINEADIALTRPEEKFGDYATNVALQLAGKLGRKPREVAQELAGHLQEELAGLARDITVAGPGFLNITLGDKALYQLAATTPSENFRGKKIIIEYSDPNPFKPLHAGHLYTTLVGDMITRLIEQAGASTIRVNYGGDVGLHVAKSMWGITTYLGGEQPEKLSDIPEDDRPKWLGERYAAGHRAYEDDPQAKQEIIAYNKRVYELHEAQDKNSAFARIYWTCREWSYDYFAMLYDQLEVVPFDRYIPESEVTPLGIQAVREHTEKGVYEKSDGAVIFDGERYNLHKRVFINSEGLPTYEAKDVGLSLAKWRDYHFDQSIIITAAEQAQYMLVVIKSIEQFAPEPAQRTRHLTHGTVKLQGGVKMSSRMGNVVTAVQILESAREAARATGSTDEHTVLAAVKYAFAKNRIGSDIIYDPKESIALEGNSGPYLQYAHARARSILAKAQANHSVDHGKQLQGDERSLLRKITEYPEAVEKATQDLMPHHICTYLYELAQMFNSFYEHNRVLDDERETVRLDLVKRYAGTLKQGLNLLGIHAPDKM